MYLYETHMHTCQASACGKSTGREHARYYKDHGYQGIIITDHFFGGNTACARAGSWVDRVHQFASGYEDAWNEGQRIGLDVFFGWEQNYDGDEYLIYGPDVQWMIDHPEIEHCSRADQLRLVHEAGGAIIQAHPFRVRDYLSRITLGLDYADGAEIANAGNTQVSDYYANIYAKQYGLIATCGSDNHHSFEGCPLYGIGLEKPIADLKELARLIRAREGITPVTVAGRLDRPENDVLTLHSYMLDANEQHQRYTQPWLKEIQD